jgi:hypothetical protein
LVLLSKAINWVLNFVTHIIPGGECLAAGSRQDYKSGADSKMKIKWSKRYTWYFIALAGIGCGSVEDAPTGSSSPKSFGVTGKMNVPRRDHTATLLDDGSVLIAGGIQKVSGDVSDKISSSEIYVPSTGRFRVTGSLPESRSGHVAVLLADGRVMVAGGGDARIALYDPRTVGWSSQNASTEMTVLRTATRLPDGRIFLLGDAETFAEIYDPQSGVLNRTGQVGTTRVGQTATLMPDGNILIAGGGVFSLLAERFEPDTGVFRGLGNANLQTDRFGHTATLLGNGKVVLSGGSRRISGGLYRPIASIEVYDPETESFSLAGSMGGSRFGHTATLLEDGTVLFVGGSDADVEIYDPSTETSRVVGPNEGRIRTGGTATRLQDGRILYAGGVNTDFALLENGLIYNP